MKTPVRLFCVVGLFLASAGWTLAEQPKGDSVSPSAAPAVVEEGWFHWPASPTWPWLEPAAVSHEPAWDFDPEGTPFPHWYMPVELFTQVGPIFEIGRGKLTNALGVGMAFEIGAKNYVYDADNLAAWLGTLGYEYQFSPALSRDSVVVHHRVSDVLDFMTKQGVWCDVGREWYYRGNDIPEAWRYVFGLDVAGHVGMGREHFRKAPSSGNVNVGGQIVPLFILDISEVDPWISIGAYAGVVIPRQHFDLIFAGHLEYQHMWTDLVDTDKNLDEFVLLLSASIRY